MLIDPNGILRISHLGNVVFCLLCVNVRRLRSYLPNKFITFAELLNVDFTKNLLCLPTVVISSCQLSDGILLLRNISEFK